MSPPRSALLVIDNQRGFAHPTFWGPARSNPSYEANIAALLAAARAANLFVVHVRHLSQEPDSALHPSAPAPPNHPAGGLGVDFEPSTEPVPGEPVVDKHVNSAFIGTNLEELLRGEGVRTLYLAGLTTDHCVSTTTRMAGNLRVCGKGGRVVFVEDATACWQKTLPGGGAGWAAETVHAVHAESLREFAEIAKTAEVVRSLKAEAV
jgi:nicotinamidase-related amidase